jgi:hypothetical protein
LPRVVFRAALTWQKAKILCRATDRGKPGKFAHTLDIIGEEKMMKMEHGKGQNEESRTEERRKRGKRATGEENMRKTEQRRGENEGGNGTEKEKNVGKTGQRRGENEKNGPPANRT